MALIDVSQTEKQGDQLKCSNCGGWAKMLFTVTGHYGQKPVCHRCVSQIIKRGSN